MFWLQCRFFFTIVFTIDCCRGNVVPVRVGGGTAPLILLCTEVSGQLHAPTALPSVQELPVLIEQETVWVPEPVWTFCLHRQWNPRLSRQ
jgi:hypothetical protein